MGMRKWIAAGCVVGVVLSLGACAWRQTGTTYDRTLDLDWSRNDTWRVRVQFWPRRLEDPYTRSAVKQQRTWSYRVEETPGSGASGRYKIIQRSGSSRYLLLFGTGFNLLEVHRLIEPVGRYWKTRRLRVNTLGGGAFFYRSTDGTHPAVFWFHPGLTGRQRGTPRRMNFSTLGRLTGDWITQRVTRTRKGLLFELVHAGSSTRVAFVWHRGQPWWEQAEWYYRERLIALARRRSFADVKPPAPETAGPSLR